MYSHRFSIRMGTIPGHATIHDKMAQHDRTVNHQNRQGSAAGPAGATATGGTSGGSFGGAGSGDSHRDPHDKNNDRKSQGRSELSY